ncbi:MAG: FtsX-like permease family protein, partial [Terriglobales bacterium]
PGYLATMGIPLLRGRFFQSGDLRNAPPVAAIDTTLARDIFPGRDPVGQTLNLGPLGAVRIVGVVGHVKFWGPMQMPMIHDQLYFPVGQVPLAYMAGAGQGVTLVARTRGRPEAALAAIRHSVAGPQNDQPVSQVASMDDVIAASRSTQRLLLWLLGGFAGLAVLLAAIGVYGVLAYAVAERTGEIGVRLALGATPSRLLRDTLGGGLRLAALGAVLGIGGALATTRFLTANLYGVSAADPATLAAAAVVLLALAALASYLPARRASRVDPMQALRQS